MLLVCTANQCRSPMGEALLRDLVTTQAIEARAASAGLYPSGSPATRDAVAVMAERGLELGGHRSRQIDHPLLARADLVLGMAREHVREVAVVDGSFLAKTFTLKELVQLGDRVGPRSGGETHDTWMARLGTARRREALIGVGHDDTYDIADPIGGTRAQYRSTAKELDALLGRMVELAWPGRGSGQARGLPA